MSGIREIVSKNLRVLRATRDMSQEDLAGAAEIDRTYVSMLENNHYAASIDKVEDIAKALRVEAWELLHPDTADRYRTES